MNAARGTRNVPCNLSRLPSVYPINMQDFRALVAEHRDRVFSLACYMLHDREEAEDVTQEVLLRMWQKLDALDKDRVGAWLMRVTRNACIDAHRRRTVKNRMLNVNTESISYRQAPATDHQPDECTEAVDFESNLREAIATLPEPHRSIVVFREVNDLKYQEISDILSLPLNTVKVYLHRARKMLRDELRKRLDYAPLR